jgi:hypothetical protein
MKTTSQSKEKMSGHAAQESSRKPGRVTPSNTFFSGTGVASVIHRASEALTRARPLIKPFIGFLFFASLGALAVGLVSHFTVVVPLEKNLLAAEARSLATEFDSAIRIRSSLISITAGDSELDSFLESGGLDKMLNALRKQFPDFLSFEATNDRGQVQAMGGDLPLSQTGLFSKDPSGKISTHNLGVQHNRGIFYDDPKNNCFYITCKHVGPEGGKWFTRSRFSREAVVTILKSGPTRRVTLMPIAGASKEIPESPISLPMPQLCVVRPIGSWWSGPTGAEALLTMPGWLMRMEKITTRSILWRAPIAVPLCLVLCSVIASIMLEPAPLREVHEQDGATDTDEEGQSPVLDENSSAEPESFKKSASLSEGGGEKSLPAVNDRTTSELEVEYGKRAASAQSLESACREDLPGVTKLVTIPAHKSPVETTDVVGQEPCSDDSAEVEPVPDTLEVCWFEPCDQCENGKAPSEKKDERLPLSDEEKSPGSGRSTACGHLLSTSG